MSGKPGSSAGNMFKEEDKLRNTEMEKNQTVYLNVNLNGLKQF